MSMGRLGGRKNSKGGYTLAELLIVVGIMAVLAAVSIPAVINVRNSMRQRELDDRALSIFIAAQNQLSGLSLCGEMPVPGAFGTGDCAMDGFPDPSDYREDQGERPDTYAICDGDLQVPWMSDTAFSGELMRADGGSYVIEYNRSNALVYAVFYWEEKGGAFQKDSLFSYRENFNQYHSLDLRGDENKENRKIPSVGYYGGGAGVVAEGREDLEFEVRLENEEELQVAVSMAPSFWERTAYQITVESKTDPEHSQAYTYRLEGENLTLLTPQGQPQSRELWEAVPATEDGRSEYVITLDSLRGGLHFADNFPGIAAGDDLRISVVGYSTGENQLYIPQVRTVEANSLFAGLREGDGRGNTVYIGNGRHLQNLSYEVSGLGRRLVGEGFQTEEASAWSPRRARLTADIDWTEAVYDTGETKASWDDVCTARGSETNVNFYPISNPQTGLLVFEGNRHVIRNLYVSRSAVLDYGGRSYGYAGLFGWMEGSEADGQVVIRQVDLVNPVIAPRNDPEGITESYAGGVAGYLQGARLEQCRTYIDGQRDENLSDRYKACGVIAQSSYAGGLVGLGADLKAKESSASIQVTAAGAAGGVAGKLTGKSVAELCYSGGHTEKGAYSRELPNVSGRQAAGGFAGVLEGNVFVTKSFSTCSVWGPACGAFLGRADLASPSTQITLTYGLGAAFAQGGAEENQTGCGQTEALLEQGAGSLDRLGTHPYDELYRANATAFYPFPSWLKSYYGDWVGASMTGLVYYERYQLDTDPGGEEYGFWSPGADGYNTLRDDVPVRSDGYGYLGGTGQSVIKIPGYTAQSDGLTCITVSSAGMTQYLYVFPWENVIHRPYPDFNGGNDDRAFYDALKLDIDGTPLTFYYNPHFAQAIALTGEEAKTAPESAVLRTARQLYELGCASHDGRKGNEAYWSAGWKYVQKRDIDCLAYDLSTYSGEEIYRGKDAQFVQGIIGDGAVGEFYRTYDGEGHSIAGLRIERQAGSAALFGTLGTDWLYGTGSVQNLKLVRPVMTAWQGSGNADAAGLAIKNLGTIKNVSVVSPKIYAVSGAAAGLAVYNQGKGEISGCYVMPEQPGKEGEPDRYRHIYGDGQQVLVNNYTNALITSPIAAAGLVYANSADISQCGASCAVTNGSYEEAGGRVEHGLGGIAAGFVNQNSGSIRQSYANCYTAGWMAAGFVNTTSTEISSCYALRRVTSVTSGGYAAGFAGETSYGAIRDSYAAVSLGYSRDYHIDSGRIFYDDCVYTGAPSILYPFTNNYTGKNCYFMGWSENYVKKNAQFFGEEVTYRQLRDGLAIDGLSKARPDGEDTEAYSRLIAPIYPFPKAAGLTQYGDWPSYEYVGAEMAYFEIYKEGSAYTVGLYNESLNLNTLRDDKPIFLDGYGLLFNQEYIDMDDINIQNLIQNGSSNKKAYLAWEDNKGGDNTTVSATNYLKSVFNLKDNSGTVFSEKGFTGSISYYRTDSDGSRAFEEDRTYGDQPIELKVGEREGKFYFRILPPAAVVTNAYVEDGSVYQPINIYVESSYRDEGGGQGAGDKVEKSRTFYYCPHFAKSAIGVGERPEEPKELIIRTLRQLCTLGFENNCPDNGISNYYSRTFRQEQNIPLGSGSEYAYFYSDSAPMNQTGGRDRQNYRWFNSTIGSKGHPFTGTYRGDGYQISGLGAWKDGSKVRDFPGFSSLKKLNEDTSLFGFLEGRVENLVIADSEIFGGTGVLCANADGAEIEGVIISNAELKASAGPAGLLAGESKGNTRIIGCRIEKSGVYAPAVSWVGGAIGKLYGGSVQDLTFSGGLSVEGLRAVGGVCGQILSSEDVSLGGIAMEGAADIRQSLADYSSGANRQMYNAAGLIAGLCEVNHPVTMDGLVLTGYVPGSEGSAVGQTDLLTVKNGADCYSYVGGLLVGSMFQTAGTSGNRLIVGDVKTANCRLLTDTECHVGETPVCYYGCIAGNIKSVDIKPVSEQSVWDFSGCRIEVVSERLGKDSAVAGLTGRFAEAGTMELPGRVLLPDMLVKSPDRSVPVGGILGSAAKCVTVTSAAGNGSEVCLGNMTVEGCQNAGGLTAVLTDNTVFRGIGLTGRDGGSGIRSDGNVGAVAGSIKTSKPVENLSARGLAVIGFWPAAGAQTEAAVGGFAGLLESGAVKNCFADVTVSGGKSAPAGGFVGRIDGGNISRCYASGTVTGRAQTGGFFGAIIKGGAVKSCYATGDVFYDEDAAQAEAGAAGTDAAEVGVTLPSWLGGFGGELRASSGSVDECYSLGRVPENLMEPVKAGGFLGSASGPDIRFEEVDPMLCSLIDIMKRAEVHNRPVNQNGTMIWDMAGRPQMDSSTVGVFDSAGNSALVYNILGYPYYPNALKRGIEGSAARASAQVMREAYDNVFSGEGALLDPESRPDYAENPDYEAGAHNSYYENVYRKSQELGVMTLWRMDSEYIYWINERDVREGSFTAFRAPLKKYERAASPGERRGLIEVNPSQQVVSFGSSYSTTYYVLNTTATGWSGFHTKNCYFLREDGSVPGFAAYNAAFPAASGSIEGWSVGQFEQEMQLEAAGSGGARLTEMVPAPENTGYEYLNYPYPMLYGVGAGENGLSHTGGWPEEYHPILK